MAGCIYIAASVTEPGFIHLSSDVFKIVYGFLDGNLKDQRLLEVASDLAKSGITPVYSDNIKRDTFKKFTMVSPMAAVGTYCNVTALAFKHASQARDMYIKCVEELVNLAAGMEIDIPEDIVDINLEIIKILKTATPLPCRKTSVPEDKVRPTVLYMRLFASDMSMGLMFLFMK